MLQPAMVRPPYDFKTGNELGVPVGRINIGKHVGRLYFIMSEQKTILVISEEAIKDKSIIFGVESGFGGVTEIRRIDDDEPA